MKKKSKKYNLLQKKKAKIEARKSKKIGISQPTIQKPELPKNEMASLKDAMKVFNKTISGLTNKEQTFLIKEIGDMKKISFEVLGDAAKLQTRIDRLTDVNVVDKMVNQRKNFLYNLLIKNKDLTEGQLEELLDAIDEATIDKLSYVADSFDAEDFSAFYKVDDFEPFHSDKESDADYIADIIKQLK